MQPPSVSRSAQPPPRLRRLWPALIAGLALAGLVTYLVVDRASPPPAAEPGPAASDLAALEVRVAADARPLADATITLASARIHRKLTSDQEGVARAADLPTGPLGVTIEARGHARLVSSIDVQAGQQTSRFELAPGVILRGQALDESDRPVPGANVVARLIGTSDAARGEPWTALTDADGNFEIFTLPHAAITLDVDDGGQHEPASIAELKLPAAEPVRLVLQRTAALGGRVLTPEGTLAAGATVTLAGSGVWPARHVDCDTHGEFRFEHVPEGIYEARAELASSVSEPLEGVVIEPGNQARVELTLSPGASLRGAVHDTASGHAVPDAEVEVAEESLSATPKRTRTQLDGSFSLTGLRAQNQRVTVRATGYVTLQSWLTPGAAPYKAELLRAVRVAGRIEDADGRPIARAEIEVSGRSLTGQAIRMVGALQETPQPVGDAPLATADNLGVTSGAVPRVPIVARTGAAGAATALLGDSGFHSDDSGDYTLTGLPPGELTVIARKPGFGVGRSQQLQVRPGASLTEVAIVLPRGATLTGRTLDSDGMPVAHVRVDLTVLGELPRSTTSADDGTFRFEAAHGDCALAARPLGAPAVRLTIPAADVGRRDVDLVLERTSERLGVRVVDVHGQPIESATIHVETSHGRGFATTGVSGSDGSYQFDALPAPPYSIRVEHTEFAPSATLQVSDARKPLIVRLDGGAVLAGLVVRSSSDEPVAGARVSIRAGEVDRSTRSGRDGRFELRQLPLGKYTLIVDADSFIPARTDGALVAMAAGEALFERIGLVQAGSISGDVVDRLGATVWNAQVAAGQPPDWANAVRTDHDGHFELEELPPGMHLLTARHGTQQVAASAAVKVLEGQDAPGLVLRFPGMIEDVRDPDDSKPDPSAEPRSSRGAAGLSVARRGSAVVVERVATGSAAERSGLEAGDVLVSVDGEPVRSPGQARGMLAFAPSRSASLTLDVRRSGAPMRLHYVPAR